MIWRVFSNLDYSMILRKHDSDEDNCILLLTEMGPKKSSFKKNNDSY